MIQHILFVHKDDSPCAAARDWTVVRAPWCNEEDLDLIIDEIGPYPHLMTDRELGEALEVTDEIRTKYDWRTIEAIDVDEEQRAAINRERDRKRKEAERRADGVVPREQFEAKSKARTKPWVALGISESTYYRRLRKEWDGAAATVIDGDRGVSETDYLLLSRTDHCHEEARPEGRASGASLIRPNLDRLTGSCGRGGNPSAGEAANDNPPPPAGWEAPTEVAA
jgi:hypothetical protein